MSRYELLLILFLLAAFTLTIVFAPTEYKPACLFPGLGFLLLIVTRK